MTPGRCNISTQNLFIFILCVAVGSLILTFHVSMYGSRITVEQRIENELYSMQDLRVHTDRYDAKILGRSLNQHGSGTLRLNTTEAADLHTQLVELEARLLKTKRRVIAVTPTKQEDDVSLLKQFHQLDIEIVGIRDGLSWVTTDTIVQGNWSVLFCMEENNCRNVKADISQKVDMVPELSRLIKDPEHTCAALMATEGNFGQCEPFRCNSVLNESTVLVSENKIYYNTTSYKMCKSGADIFGAYVWYLPTRPVTFPNGEVIRLHSVITSLSPLRFYVHPEMQTGPFAAFMDRQLLKKSTIEDLLQYISELYGLGTSSRWWREIQRRLLLYLLYTEQKLLNSDVKPRCKRCFIYLEIDVVCSSVHFCQIFSLRPGEYGRSTSIMKSLKTLVSADVKVADEIGPLLTQNGYSHIKNFHDIQLVQQDQITEDLAIYLLDWQREIRSPSDWISIYPSNFGCMEMAREIRGQDRRSPTLRFNDITKQIGDTLHWNELSSTEIQYSTDGEDVDYSDLRLVKHSGYTERTDGPCSNDSKDYGKLEDIFIHPAVELEQLSPNSYTANVGYDIILVRITAVSKSCRCQVRLENKYNDPGARNITLGLGETKIMLYVVDKMSTDTNIVNTVVINIYRTPRGLRNEDFDENLTKLCALKQDCSLRFDQTSNCGLSDMSNSTLVARRPRCSSGDNKGQWTVPCKSCEDENQCFWEMSKWRADDCQYEHLAPADVKQCLHGKKLLFIGDSTNRGVSNYIMELVNGSLYEWDKTHSTRVYSNINNGKTYLTFAYYPHFWLPADHRPRFSKVIYQLIKSSLPLQNNSNTILVVGGVHWLAKQHIDLIVEALQRKGLSGITKVVKGLGAGFHQPVENVKYVPSSEHTKLQQRERDIFDYAKTKHFRTVATFNMTISRYKDFREGNCACHFHKVSKYGSVDNGFNYVIDGDINAAYSQILLNQICHDT